MSFRPEGNLLFWQEIVSYYKAHTGNFFHGYSSGSKGVLLYEKGKLVENRKTIIFMVNGGNISNHTEI
jgi:hypothetical protein